VNQRQLPYTSVAFIAYAIILSTTLFHHELWGDELHSWNIAKASKGFADLISNTRYEGHPPFWYSILWVASKFTQDVSVIQWIQLFISLCTGFLILFASPYPLTTRLLLPFGYFFLYEYGVFSRNYAIGFLCAFLVCIILHSNFKQKILLYYVFLFLLAHTHLLALALAAAFHIYFLLVNAGQKKAIMYIHVLAGFIVLFPAAWFIFPPADSSLGTDFWLHRWDTEQLSSVIKAPVKAFLPVPAWWNFHFWNTNFLTEAQTQWPILKWVTGILSAALMAFTVLLLRKNRNVFLFYMSVLLFIFPISIFIPFASARQTGFLFMGFLLAYWLFSFQQKTDKSHQMILFVVLIIQMLAGIFSVVKEIKYPFSNSFRVTEMSKEIPENTRWVTDYWCLNTISAYLNIPAYCIDLQKEKTFLLWNVEMKTMLQSSNRYFSGMNALFERENRDTFYLLTVHSPQSIIKIDSLFYSEFKIEMTGKREGAIEKSGNLYLYRVRRE
jgi:hypothetical protein